MNTGKSFRYLKIFSLHFENLDFYFFYCRRPLREHIIESARQDRRAILGKIFAYFPLIFRRWYPIRRFFAHMFMDYAYFRLFPPLFTYFPPEMVPILIMNSSMLPICHFSAHMFTDSAYFSLIFCLFSA